jgi:hypothetical protein
VRRRGGRILLGDNAGCHAAADHQVTLCWDLDFCWNPFYLHIRSDSKVSIDGEVIQKSPYLGKMASVFTKLALYVHPARMKISIRYSLNKDISGKKNSFNPYQYGDV